MSRREVIPARAAVFALCLGVFGCSGADDPGSPTVPPSAPQVSGVAAVPNLDLPAEVDPSVVVGADG